MTDYVMCKELVDALHEQGYHVVTRQEWYEIQGKLAQLESAS